MLATKLIGVYVLATVVSLTYLLITQTQLYQNLGKKPRDQWEEDDHDMMVKPFDLKTVDMSKKLDEDYFKRAVIIMLKTKTSSMLESYTFIQTVSKYVCDKSTDGRCDIRLDRDYVYGELGYKTRDLLDRLCEDRANLPEVFMKIDDDTIFEKEDLNQIIGAFINSDCIYAGHMSSFDRPYYWSGGEVYMLKKAALHKACNKRREIIGPLAWQEDVFIGQLLNLRDKNLACSARTFDMWHRGYRDERVEFKYLVNH